MPRQSGGRGGRRGLSPAARHQFDGIERVLAEREPRLALYVDDREAVIKGSVEVPRGAGLVEEIAVELRFVDRDPFHPPEAWDAARRFDPDPDRHVEDHGPRGWRFCLWIAAEERVQLDRPEDMLLCLDEVRDHLRRQLIYDERRRAGAPKPWWPGPQWKHGNLGLAEWVLETLGDPDLSTVERLFPFLADRPLSVKKKCPCGSGLIAGKCHRNAVMRVRMASSALPVRELLPAIRQMLKERNGDDARAESA